MKRFLLCLLALLLLAGCGEKAPQPVKLDDSFVIVCGEEEMEAAVCLQTTLAQLDILMEQLGGYMEQYPTLVCGDFNARPDGGVYARMTERCSDPHVTAGVKPSDTEYTYTDYGTTDDPRRLDYLFYDGHLVADTYRILTEQYDGYISDHFGVTVQYSFAP